MYVDEHCIEQRIINFINNVMKCATNSDKIAIEFENSGNKIKVSLKDFGKGIDYLICFISLI